MLQVAAITEQLEKLLDSATVSQEMGRKVFDTISNMMGGEPQALAASANKYISPNTDMCIYIAPMLLRSGVFVPADRLIQMVDDVGKKLVLSGDGVIISSPTMVLAVKAVNGTDFPETSVDIFKTDNIQVILT